MVVSTLKVVLGELVVVLGAGVVAIPRLPTSNLLTVPKILKMDFIALVFRHHLARDNEILSCAFLTFLKAEFLLIV